MRYAEGKFLLEIIIRLLRERKSHFEGVVKGAKSLNFSLLVIEFRKILNLLDRFGFPELPLPEKFTSSPKSQYKLSPRPKKKLQQLKKCIYFLNTIKKYQTTESERRNTI